MRIFGIASATPRSDHHVLHDSSGDQRGEQRKLLAIQRLDFAIGSHEVLNGFLCGLRFRQLTYGPDCNVRDQRGVNRIAEVDDPRHSRLIGSIYDDVAGIEVVVDELPAHGRKARRDGQCESRDEIREKIHSSEIRQLLQQWSETWQLPQIP